MTTEQTVEAGGTITAAVTDPVLFGIVQKLSSKAQEEATTGSGAGNNSGSDDGNVDIAIRSRFQQLLLQHYQDDEIQQAAVQSTSSRSAAVQEVGKYWIDVVDVCSNLLSAEQQKTSLPFPFDPRTMPFILMSDALDMITSRRDMEDFWTHDVEPELLGRTTASSNSSTTTTSGGGRLLDPSIFFVKETRFQFLKVCNQLLHSIGRSSTSPSPSSSTSSNQVWKGRVMLSLSKGFSIGDASGRQTHHHHPSAASSKSDDNDKMDVEDTAAASDNSNGLDAAFKAFITSMNEIATMDSTNSNIDQRVFDLISKSKPVFEAFESAPSGHIATGNNSQERSSVLEARRTYHSSSTVLHAQVNDRAFRSIVIAQFLIVASNLSFESPRMKIMLDKTTKRACKLLLRDDKALYDHLWTPILQHREVTWRRWKKDLKSIPSAFLPKGQQVPSADEEGPAGDAEKSMTKLLSSTSTKTKTQSERKGDDGGNDDLARIGSDLREKTPTLDQHLQPYVDALDPENGIEEAYHPKNDSLYIWRANRLYAKHQLHRLSNCRGVGDLEKITRDYYRDKGVVIPGEVEEQEEEEEQDHEENENEEEKVENDGGDDDMKKEEAPDTAEADEIKVEADASGGTNDPSTDAGGDVVMKEEPAEPEEKVNDGADPVAEIVNQEGGGDDDTPVVQMKEEGVKKEDEKEKTSESVAPGQGQKRERPTETSSDNGAPVTKKSPMKGNNPGRGGGGRGRGRGGGGGRSGGGGPGFGDQKDHRDYHHHHRGGPPDRDGYRGGGGGGGRFDGRNRGRGGGRGRGGRGRGRGGRS
mmetsp:Transcript_47100/g.114965  ORF Transcript_47100/g.114965 Transcript_47100/m.114965 type:complete len:811 (-) Transcript_47100:60-2492(-)